MRKCIELNQTDSTQEVLYLNWTANNKRKVKSNRDPGLMYQNPSRGYVNNKSKWMQYFGWYLQSVNCCASTNTNVYSKTFVQMYVF